MKLSNCVVGQVIEAKRDVRGLSNERIHKGMQVTVGRLDAGATYNLRIQHPSLECGYAWVNPADFRKVKEVEQGDAVPEDVQEGTKVVCIRGFVEPRFSDTFTAGVIYEVRQDGLDHDGELRLEHPTLGGGHGYGKPQDFRLYKEPQEVNVPTPSAGIDFSGLRDHQERMLAPKQPVAPVLTEVCSLENTQVGDFITATVTGDGIVSSQPLVVGEQYEVLEVVPQGTAYTGFTVCVRVPDSLYDGTTSWHKGYYMHIAKFTKPVKEPVVEPEPVVQEFQEGDVLECITACEGMHHEQCVTGRLYRFSRHCVHGGRDGIEVHDPELWCNHALVLPENFKLYARPVKDSTNADTPTA